MKKELLKGETGVKKSTMWTRTCVKMEMMDGRIIYKEKKWGNHPMNWHIIIEEQDGSFMFIPYKNYLYPSISHRFQKYFSQHMPSELKSPCFPHILYFKKGKKLKILITDSFSRMYVYNVDDPLGIVKFDNRCNPIGLSRYVPKEIIVKENIW